MKRFFFILLLFMMLTPLPGAAREHTVAETSYSFTVSAYSWKWLYYADLPSESGTYGEFTVESDRDINFFVVDTAGYNIIQGGSATDPERDWGERTGTVSFTFINPYEDSWYFCWSNYDSLFSVDISGHIGIDYNGPTISITGPSSSNVEGNVQISASATDDHFSVEEMRIYIGGSLKRSTYSSSISFIWDSTSVSDGSHTVEYYAMDTVGNERTLTRTLYVDNVADTTAPTTRADDTTLSPAVVFANILPMLIIIVFLGLAGAVIYGRERKTPAPTAITVRPPPPRPTTRPISERTVPMVLVVCPYCGAKTEQGLLKCHNCNAEL